MHLSSANSKTKKTAKVSMQANSFKNMDSSSAQLTGIIPNIKKHISMTDRHQCVLSLLGVIL